VARRARPPRHRLGSMRDRVIRTERSGRPVSNDVSHSIIGGLYTRNASTSEARHNFMRAVLWHPPHGGTLLPLTCADSSMSIFRARSAMRVSLSTSRSVWKRRKQLHSSSPTALVTLKRTRTVTAAVAKSRSSRSAEGVGDHRRTAWVARGRIAMVARASPPSYIVPQHDPRPDGQNGR
jgi:hypothetical protein